jgi:hypothetical protein
LFLSDLRWFVNLFVFSMLVSFVAWSPGCARLASWLFGELCMCWLCLVGCLSGLLFMCWLIYVLVCLVAWSAGWVQRHACLRMFCGNMLVSRIALPGGGEEFTVSPIAEELIPAPPVHDVEVPVRLEDMFEGRGKHWYVPGRAVPIGRITKWKQGQPGEALSANCQLHSGCTRIFSKVQLSRWNLGDGTDELKRWLLMPLQTPGLMLRAEHQALPKPLPLLV